MQKTNPARKPKRFLSADIEPHTADLLRRCAKVFGVTPGDIANGFLRDFLPLLIKWQQETLELQELGQHNIDDSFNVTARKIRAAALRRAKRNVAKSETAAVWHDPSPCRTCSHSRRSWASLN